jgi:hypothetical protein
MASAQLQKKLGIFVAAVSVALIVGALMWFYYRCDAPISEGFQANLPTAAVTITGFVIYSNINTIMQKIPFVQSSFSDVFKYDPTTLTSPVASLSGTGTLFQNLTNLVTSDAVDSLYSFKLKSVITGMITQTEIDTLNNVSKELFGTTGRIAYVTSTGALFPNIVLPTAVTSTATSIGSSTGTTPLANKYYKDNSNTLYFYDGTKFWRIPFNDRICPSKLIPPITSTQVLPLSDPPPAAQVAPLTSAQCSLLPPPTGYYKESNKGYLIYTSGTTSTYYPLPNTTFTCPGKTIPALTDPTINSITPEQLAAMYPTGAQLLDATNCATILP